nr:FimB/Mfa2 family fimbrial subunit [Bacteroides acidifaciens]
MDAAPTQVGDITILAFDKNDKYVDRLDVDSITLHQSYCMVRVPFPAGTYHLLIWGGASDYPYQLPNLKAERMERKSLNISLACDEKNQSDRKLNALFHSRQLMKYVSRWLPSVPLLILSVSEVNCPVTRTTVHI